MRGIGNKFLANIRETHAIAHVVRCFEDDDVAHVAGKVSPADDIAIIDTELMLADLEQVERARERAVKSAKAGDRESRARQALMERAAAQLDAGRPLRALEMDSSERDWMRQLQPLTGSRCSTSPMLPKQASWTILCSRRWRLSPHQKARR